MRNDVDTGSASPTCRATLGPIGEPTGLTKQAVKSAAHPNTEVGEATSGADVSQQITVVQFSLLYDGDEEKFDHLHALRNCQHRMLNAAFDAWRIADKVPSKTNPNKETLDRGAVTAAVKVVLEREREHWAKQMDICLSQVEKLRAKKEDLTSALRDVARTRVRSELQVPSSVYDSTVRFTQSRLALYKKESFRGTRSADSFRSGAPVRWRDGSWELVEGERRGQYELSLEISSDGKRVRRGKFVVIPDGPSMHGFAKKMVDPDSDIKLCDARVVWSENKKQWFAKLTIKYPRPAKIVGGTKIAALRRGVKNAFVIAFEDGRTEYISGDDVLHFKRKIKARKTQVSRHKNRLEVGTGARGRGTNRREAALRKINDGESRFVDWRCKTWAAAIAKLLMQRGVGTLLVSKMNKAETFDGNDFVEALLYQWPFARMLGNVKQALEKVGIVVKEYLPTYDARRCPDCGHVHAKAPNKDHNFVCEVCKYERGSDSVVAWNGLIAATSPDVFKKAKKVEKEVAGMLVQCLGKQ